MRYGYYLVAFVDVLGQQDELGRLVLVPHIPEARDAAMEIIRKTAGRVRALRSGFQTYFREAASNHRSVAGLTPDQAREYNSMRTLTFHQVGFSDTFVISVPLIEQEYGAATAALGVWSTLFGVAGMFLAAMATHIPLRAGIDVERGIDIFPNEVYGPALVSAYNLESTVAQYPRAVVGKGLLDYLAYLERTSSGGRWSTVARGLASDCRQLLSRAPDDGVPILHMLAPKMLSAGKQMTEPADAAYKWVKQELQRHGSAGETKLTGYYARLLRYFNESGYTG